MLDKAVIQVQWIPIASLNEWIALSKPLELPKEIETPFVASSWDCAVALSAIQILVAKEKKNAWQEFSSLNQELWAEWQSPKEQQVFVIRGFQSGSGLKTCKCKRKSALWHKTSPKRLSWMFFMHAGRMWMMACVMERLETKMITTRCLVGVCRGSIHWFLTQFLRSSIMLIRPKGEWLTLLPPSCDNRMFPSRTKHELGVRQWPVRFDPFLPLDLSPFFFFFHLSHPIPPLGRTRIENKTKGCILYFSHRRTKDYSEVGKDRNIYTQLNNGCSYSSRMEWAAREYGSSPCSS